MKKRVLTWSGLVGEEFIKKFIVHRFDSLAKVVVSAVLQGSVDVFQKRFLIIPAACRSPICIVR